MGLARRSDVLLLDEPTESLDNATVRSPASAALVIALHDRQS
jgi:ATPase subunit of ABC transporter with duplicated ATPase domains